jgi:hypothetical protein
LNSEQSRSDFCQCIAVGGQHRRLRDSCEGEQPQKAISLQRYQILNGEKGDRQSCHRNAKQGERVRALLEPAPEEDPQ